MDYYLNRNIEPITYINDDGLVCYEEWRDVIGTYGHYKISDLGRVMSKLKKPLILKPFFSTSKYLTVDTHNKNSSINRLVAVAFIENTENKEQVNHIDGNKLNNSVENLEWVTNQENQIHKFKIGLGNNFTRKITQFDLEMNKIKDFNSIIEASKDLNIGKSNISGVLSNSRKTTGGFIFKYLD